MREAYLEQRMDRTIEDDRRSAHALEVKSSDLNPLYFPIQRYWDRSGDELVDIFGSVHNIPKKADRFQALRSVVIMAPYSMVTAPIWTISGIVRGSIRAGKFFNSLDRKTKIEATLALLGS
jgi:hypothetical protein